MKTLESSKYFSDPKVAAFVDRVQQGDVAAVKAGLAQGIDPNSRGIDGFRPIHFVFTTKQPDVLKLLLAAGADPNARLSNGNAPLIFSVRMENIEFTSALLGAGADPNIPGENDKLPIHESVYQINPGHIPLLAAGGAKINEIWGGTTPLMSAFEIAKWETARVLIDQGADLSLKSETGKTAPDYACKALNRYPANDANRKGVQAIVAAFERRHATLSCTADVAKFK